MTTSDAILRWLRETTLARADRTVTVPGGVIVLNSRFPQAHDHNRMLLWSDVDAATAARSIDTVFGGAGLEHRLIDVASPALADRLEAGLAAQGYRRSNDLVMTYDRVDPPSPVDIDVVELDLAQRIAAAIASWRAEQPDWPDDVCRQLGERIETVAAASDPTFFAVRGGAGVAAHADLYLRAGVAQVEEVFTEPAYRKQGLAAALVRECVRRAFRADADAIFLIADADEWTVDLYRRLGFTDLHTMASFTR